MTFLKQVEMAKAKGYKDTEEIAAHFGVTINTVRVYSSRGKWPSHKLGRKLMFKVEEIEAAIADRVTQL